MHCAARPVPLHHATVPALRCTSWAHANSLGWLPQYSLPIHTAMMSPLMKGWPSPASALHCVSQYICMYKEVNQKLGQAETHCRYDIQHINQLPGWADGHVRSQITSCDMCEVFLPLLSVGACISPLAMPSCPLGELTPDEEECKVVHSLMPDLGCFGW